MRYCSDLKSGAVLGFDGSIVVELLARYFGYSVVLVECTVEYWSIK